MPVGAPDSIANNPKPYRQWRAGTRRLLGPPKPQEGNPLAFSVEVVETIEGWFWGEDAWIGLDYIYY